MSRHLKTRILSGLNAVVSYYVPHSAVSATHTRGVRYFVPVECVNTFWGKMNSVKEGRQHKQHIIVRRYPHHRAVLQIYTYHFPKTWSAACVANREIIKEAQRRAHALEHDCSYAAMEWHIRFLKHYFSVCKGGAKPEPGLKPYSRFYQYTYVVIYRQLKAEQAALQNAQTASENAASQPLPPTADEITFDPINHRPLRTRRSYPLQRIALYDWLACSTAEPPPNSPPW